MQCNDFVAENILARGDVGWDRDSPCVVVGNQIITCPFTWWCCAVNETASIDFEEFESGLVNGLTISTRARCKVVCDRLVMVYFFRIDVTYQ